MDENDSKCESCKLEGMQSYGQIDGLFLDDELFQTCKAIFAAVRQGTYEYAKTFIPGCDQAEFAGATARFYGDGSPITGATLTGEEEVDFEGLDRFFHGRASAWELSAGPRTPKEALRAAAEAGYAFEAFEGLLGILGGKSYDVGHEVESIAAGNLEFGLSGEAGWMDQDELPEELSEIGRIMTGAPSGRYFLVREQGEIAATAALQMTPHGCLLAGASTRPKFRGKGYQQALIARRLAEVPKGQLCLVSALVGSTSYRNMQRRGFTPLYTELTLRRMN